MILSDGFRLRAGWDCSHLPHHLPNTKQGCSGGKNADTVFIREKIHGKIWSGGA